MLVHHIDGHHFEYAIVKWDFEMKIKKYMFKFDWNVSLGVPLTKIQNLFSFFYITGLCARLLFSNERLVRLSVYQWHCNMTTIS